MTGLNALATSSIGKSAQKSKKSAPAFDISLADGRGLVNIFCSVVPRQIFQCILINSLW